MRSLQLELTAAAAGVMLLVGCAAHPHSELGTSSASMPGTQACFLRRDFSGDWQVLNNSNLIVYAPPLSTRNAFLVRLVQPVVGLNFNLRLGFESATTSPRICGNLNAFLLVPGNAPPRIAILAVQELSRAERDRLLVEAGQPPRRHVASSALANPD